MAYNGAGTFLINSAGQPVVAGTTISETVFNALTADLANGLSTAITKDGQTTATANLPMGGFKLTNLGAGTASTDSARLGQVQSGAATLIAITGTDTVVGTLTPTLTAYAAGQQFSFVAAATNTTSMTLNIDGLGAKAITRSGATALIAGDITVGKMITVIYDGTQFQTSDARVPISTGVSGLGTGVATALGVAVTGSGSVVLSASPTLTGTMTAATISATTGAFTSVSGAVTATGTSTSRTLATRFADSLNIKDFGAVGDGTTDDTAAVNAWIAAVLSTGNMGYAPAGNYKVTSPILIDYVSVWSTGFTLMGAGVQRTVFTSTVTTGAAFQLYCSGGTILSPQIGVYPKITQLAFYATTVGPTLSIGNYDFSDQQNLVRLEIWCSNSSNDSAARCIEMNSCYGCNIEYNGGIGQTNPPSYTLSAAGINLSLRKCSFSQFFVSMGSTADVSTIPATIIGTAIGVWFSDDYSYGNVFTTPDIEIFDKAVVITSANAVRNTFIGGQWAYKSYGVVATAGENNVFINPNINTNPIAPFFQSGVNAVGVSRVDASSLFNYQNATPVSGDTITVGTVIYSRRLLRLTHAATIATLTIALPAAPFDGQVLDIFTSNAVTALTITPTPFDTITTLAANSGASFFFNAGGNQWIRI